MPTPNPLTTPPLIGRINELTRLTAMYRSDRGELIALYGRRRVGKTFLVCEFAARQPGLFFTVSGIRKGQNRQQLALFQQALEQSFFSGTRIPALANWMEAFQMLYSCAIAYREAGKSTPVLILLDELPWLAGQKSDLLSALDHFWNTSFQYLPYVKIILCGSAASWIIKNILLAKGGLHNRVTGQICLKPFCLPEVAEFLMTRGFTWSRREIVNTYLIFGGVPHYLSLLDAAHSLSQNVARLCFGEGELRREGMVLFDALFGRSPEYLKIARLLAEYPEGLTRKELLKRLKRTSSGVITSRLRELREAGFIELLPSHGAGPRNPFFWLVDEFLLFSLTWIDSTETSSLLRDGETHWLLQSQKQEFKIWSGYAFERLCLKQYDRIQSALGFSAVATKVAPYRAPATSTLPGVQIDLVFDRSDNVITLVEIKGYNDPLRVSADLLTELQEKRARYIEITGTKKTVQLVLLTKEGVLENEYSRQLTKTLSAEIFLSPAGEIPR